MSYPKIILLLGPPGAGKGTQAQILAERFGYVHFETSKVIEEELRTHRDEETITIGEKTFRYGDERQLFNSGRLNTPEVVAFWVTRQLKTLAAKGQPIVFSGSPRTIFEAKELIPLLEELYGKEQIIAITIAIPPQESLYRNANRRVCERCRTPVPFFEETRTLTTCPQCGGMLIRRGSLDTPEVISIRLREYEERTRPIIAYLHERGIPLREIDGTGSIDDVADRILSTLHL